MFKSIKIKKLEINDEASQIIYRDFSTPQRKNFIVVGDNEMVVAESFEKYVEMIRNFEVQNSDVFIASYPKTGTTWASEMIWMISNNLDFAAGKTSLLERAPFLELCGLQDYKYLQIHSESVINSIKFAERQCSPRVIKTHLPFSLLPQAIQDKVKVPKIIYIMRNPKDACVSYYHHCRITMNCKCSFEDFCTVYLAGKVQYGSFWKSVLSYWDKRTWSNVLIITYEDMKNRLDEVIWKVCQLVGPDSDSDAPKNHVVNREQS